ncbi:MAG: hypothetical protein IPJ06_08445 [Saprospiraceae bacterium]|nr:hypothetical protein [Saprospiraceae bacterium]
MRFYPVFLILAILTFFSACQKSRPELSNPDHFEAYISAYSGPIINRTDPILITFTAPYGKGQEEQEVTPQPVQLLPAIGGKTIWMDAYTLQFTPVNPLTSGMEYMVDLNMGQLIQGLHDTLHHFRFVVRVKDQFLRLQTEDLTIPDPASPNLFSLKGILHTNDMADPALVEACLTVRDNNQKPAIQWDHDPNGLTHRFSLSGIQQQKEDRQFTLAIDGSPLGLELNSEQQLTIPGSALFRVSQYRVEQGSQSIVHLTFSHLVDPDQDLTGLILIREKPQLSPRFLIDANKITCYFPERLEGIYNLDVLVGVRNIQKLRLAQPYSAKTSFTQVAPQVRLAGMGMILPRSEELYFPFEAVNLEAVEVEIFKIYSNNILQFLQVNSMDGNYELQRVGKVVYRGTVDLSALNPERNNFEWVQYALDLAPLIQRDPNALYQIRIGFWPHQTGYICDGETATSSSQTEDESGDEEGYWEQEGNIEESIMNAYWGPYGYQRDYSWENRENPCAPEYYNSDRFISRNVLASDLGITVKMGDNGDLLTVVTDLRTADPIDGAQIEYYDAQLQRLASVKTDEHGMVLGRLKTYPDFVVVRSRESTGYLALRKNEGPSASDFETAGVAVQKGLRGYPYAERGVWRPGDSIFLHLILHDPEKTLPLNYPVSMEVFDPRGRLAYKTVNAEPTGAIYPFTFATLPDAPTGTWHAKFMAGGATFHHYLRVETIKPNRLKLKLDFGKDRLSAQNEPIQATLQANWLHGTPAKHQAVQIEARAHHVKPVFKKFEGYNFTHEEHQGENFSGSVWVEGRTDEKEPVKSLTKSCWETDTFPDSCGSISNSGWMNREAVSVRIFDPSLMTRTHPIAGSKFRGINTVLEFWPE